VCSVMQIQSHSDSIEGAEKPVSGVNPACAWHYIIRAEPTQYGQIRNPCRAELLSTSARSLEGRRDLSEPGHRVHCQQRRHRRQYRFACCSSRVCDPEERHNPIAWHGHLHIACGYRDREQKKHMNLCERCRTGQAILRASFPPDGGLIPILTPLRAENLTGAQKLFPVGERQTFV
jgi:hypothetical protein